MARKRTPKFNPPKKTSWQLYTLQQLQPGKFQQVVTKILKKEYLLIK